LLFSDTKHLFLINIFLMISIKIKQPKYIYKGTF
jgi:hypothetical protein